jgi:hypothetical protein
MRAFSKPGRFLPGHEHCVFAPARRRSRLGADEPSSSALPKGHEERPPRLCRMIVAEMVQPTHHVRPNARMR